MGGLRLRLFGAPSLEGTGGAPIAIARRKATALLAYLSVTGLRHPRAGLAALLWPESPPEAAYSALRNALWILRQTPVDASIVADRNVVALRARDGLFIDVVRFRELIRSADACRHRGDEGPCTRCIPILREAVDLFGAPFMDGFTLPDSPGFDDWQIAERESLRGELGRALERLVGDAISRGEPDRAVAFARRWQSADPLNETAYRGLIRSLALDGKRSEALRTFDRCCRMLDQEFGVEPEESTAELVERIRREEAERPVRREVRPWAGLPVALTQFIGRRGEIAAIRALLEDGERLITLVGLGGSGKTRLAIQTAEDVSDRFPDGAIFVPLATSSGEAEFISAAAEAVGLPGGDERLADDADRLVEAVGGRRVLLILDGAEGIAGDLGTLRRLIAGDARVIATSREPLGLSCEMVVSVAGLAVPPVDAPREEIAEYDAVRLLRLAARRAHPGAGESGGEDLADMAKVCRGVDGLPLGLELAAGWSRILPWRGIVERMTRDLDFLASTKRDTPFRHRSLRSVFEQTWSLLSDEQREALKRLSVFRGGFSSEAAEAVASVSPAELAALGQRSLVRRTGADRYVFHELIRQFARERLDLDSAETGRAADDHSRYYLGWVERAFGGMKGEAQDAALRAATEDLPNLRDAWFRAIERRDSERLARAAVPLFFVYDMRSRFEEAEELLAKTREAMIGTGIDRGIMEFVNAALGWFRIYRAPCAACAQIADAVRALESEPFGPLRALANVIAAYAGAFPTDAEHRERLDRTLGFYRESRDAWAEALALGAYVGVLPPGDADQAERMAMRSFHLRRSLGDRWGVSLVLYTLGRLAEVSGKLGLARLRYERSRYLADEAGSGPYAVILSLLGESRVARRRGRLPEADARCREAREISERIGSDLFIGCSLKESGGIRVAEGRPADARADWEAAFRIFQKIGATREIAETAACLGDLSCEEGDAEEADAWYEESRMADPGSAGAAGGRRRKENR